MHVCYINVSIQVQVDTGSTFEVKLEAVVLFLSLTEQGWWPYEFLGCTYLHLSSADFTGMFSHIENSKFYFLCRSILLVRMSVHHMNTWCPRRQENSSQIAQYWHYVSAGN